MDLENRKKLVIQFVSVLFLIIVAFHANAVNQDTRPDELSYSDKKLNHFYRKILSRLTPSEQIKFKKAQQQWIIFRDLDCAWAFQAEPLDCLIERTDNRLRELRETIFTDTKGNYTSFETSND